MNAPRLLAVSTTKNEAPYLLEWICYHKVLGFDDIIIVTNDNDDMSEDILKRIKISESFFDYVSHSVAPTTVPQMQACRLLKKFLVERSFEGVVALFDIDEFLMLPLGQSVRQFIESFQNFDVIFVNWRIYGSSGYKARPQGLVIEKFKNCATDEFREHLKFKSIFKFDSRVKMLGIHWPYFKSHAQPRFVFTDGEEVSDTIFTQKPYTKGSRIVLGAAQLNHYTLKSLEEYEAKMKRGRGGASVEMTKSQKRHTGTYFRQMDRNDIEMPMHVELVEETRALMRAIYQRANLSDIASPGFFGL